MKHPKRDFRLTTKLWEMDYRGSQAVGWLADIAPACCGENRRISDAHCPHCQKPIKLLKGMAIDIDNFVELLPKPLNEHASMAWARLQIDTDLAKITGDAPNADAQDEQLIANIEAVGWPGRATALLEEERSATTARMRKAK